MSKEQLWDDKKIDGLSVAFMKDDLTSKWIHKTIALDMRNDYERSLAFRNEDIGKLQSELKQALARIAELEEENRGLSPAYAAGTVIRDLEDELALASNKIKALEAQLQTANDHNAAHLSEIAALEKEMLQAARELVQVDEDEDLFDPVNQAVISTMYSGTAFLLDCIEEPIHLPAGYYIAKAQPAK